MDKKLEVIKYLKTVEQASLQDIYDHMPFSYYCNGNKHMGDILSRMVKGGRLVRVKKGVFKLANTDGIKPKMLIDKVDPAQSSIF